MAWFYNGSTLFFGQIPEGGIQGDNCPSSWPLAFGVLRGSILSPVLFNIIIYMKLLGEIVRGSGIWCHQYKYDAQLYLCIPPDLKEVMKTLNLGIEAVMAWMRTKKLKLNPDKKVVLLVELNSGKWLYTYSKWDCSHSKNCWLSTVLQGPGTAT